MNEERAGYLHAIERRFVGLRGRGLMLSARDVLLVDRWRQRGIPLRVVLAAIDDGVERFRAARPAGVAIPSTLAYFAGQVEDAAMERRELLVDPLDAPPRDPRAGRGAVLAAVVAAGRAQTLESAKAVLRVAWRRLTNASQEDPWSLTARVDADVVDGLAGVLEPRERADIETETDLAVARAGGDSISEQARADVRRATLERLVRERFGVPDLVEVLVEAQV